MVSYLSMPGLMSTYHRVDQIGCGRLGSVYRAQYTTTSNSAPQHVVVKVFDNCRLDDSMKTDRSHCDLVVEHLRHRDLAAFMHPNIVRVIGYFYTEATFSGMHLNIVSEFVPDNLGDCFRSNNAATSSPCEGGCMGFSRFFSVFVGVAEGLSFLHNRGVWHGNLKPSNILISESHGVPSAMICDLSFAPGKASAMSQ